MNFDANYLAVVFNSTLRMMTPILYVSLGSALCNRVFIFNIGLEGTMLTGAFTSIVVNYYTGSVLLSLLGAMISAMIVSWVAGIFMVKFQGAMLVVGVSINMIISGLTTFLMQLIFGMKGAYVSTDLVALDKIDISFLSRWPILTTMFGSLTYVDLFAFVLAFLLYLFLFRTVTGFHMRSVGINKTAAKSLGVNADRLQIGTVAFSGLLSGIGGCLLTMGGVTMFAQNITAGRGFIAMAAATLGGAHPLGVVAASAFFGLAQSMANMLQNSSISSELTMALPYLSTIFALAFYNFVQIRRSKPSKN
jgi:simple sugar transport system permease protein